MLKMTVSWCATGNAGVIALSRPLQLWRSNHRASVPMFPLRHSLPRIWPFWSVWPSAD